MQASSCMWGRQTARRNMPTLSRQDEDKGMAAPAGARARESASPRPQETDRHIGAKLRERRLSLGLTQQGLAELIGVTYQQAHKYEKGINRIAGGRLYTFAKALGVEVGYFYDGVGAEPDAFAPTTKQRLPLELSRNFSSIISQRQQEALCSLARALANAGVQDDLQLEKPAVAETAGAVTT